MIEGQKKIYKSWWICMLVVAAIFIFIHPDEETNNKQTDSINLNQNVETNSMLSKGTDNQTLTRDNSSAKETVLSTGDFTVGNDITRGRYFVTSEDTGNILVKKDSTLLVSEVLGKNEIGIGVSSLVVDLEDQSIITIRNIKKVKFTPYETNLLTSLIPGSYLVGLDVEKGKVDIVATEGSGILYIYDSINSTHPISNEILSKNTSTGLGVSHVTKELQIGQIIRLTGINNVSLIKN